MFKADVRTQVTGYEEGGLEFTVYTVVGVVQKDGGVIHYTIDGSGPTLHHAQSEFASRMTVFRRAMLGGFKAVYEGHRRDEENQNVVRLVPKKDDET